MFFEGCVHPSAEEGVSFSNTGSFDRQELDASLGELRGAPIHFEHPTKEKGNEVPVGIVIDCKYADDGRLLIDGWINSSDSNETGKLVAEQIRNKELQGLSLGWKEKLVKLPNFVGILDKTIKEVSLTKNPRLADTFITWFQQQPGERRHERQFSELFEFLDSISKQQQPYSDKETMASAQAPTTPTGLPPQTAAALGAPAPQTPAANEPKKYVIDQEGMDTLEAMKAEYKRLKDKEVEEVRVNRKRKYDEVLSKYDGIQNFAKRLEELKKPVPPQIRGLLTQLDKIKAGKADDPELLAEAEKWADFVATVDVGIAASVEEREGANKIKLEMEAAQKELGELKAKFQERNEMEANKSQLKQQMLSMGNNLSSSIPPKPVSDSPLSSSSSSGPLSTPPSLPGAPGSKLLSSKDYFFGPSSRDELLPEQKRGNLRGFKAEVGLFGTDANDHQRALAERLRSMARGTEVTSGDVMTQSTHNGLMSSQKVLSNPNIVSGAFDEKDKNAQYFKLNMGFFNT